MNPETITCTLGTETFEVALLDGKCWFSCKQISKALDLEGTVVCRYLQQMLKNHQIDLTDKTRTIKITVPRTGTTTSQRRVKHYAHDVLLLVLPRRNLHKMLDVVAWLKTLEAQLDSMGMHTSISE